MLRDVQDQRGFAHRRPRRDQDQIRILESCGPVVQIRKSGGQSCDVAFDMAGIFDLLDRVENNLADRHKAGRISPLGDLKDLLLRLVHDLFQLVLLVIAGAGNLFVGADHFPQQRFLRDNSRIGLDIGGCGHLVDQVQDHRAAVDLRRKILLAKSCLQCHGINGFALLMHLQDRGKEDSVLTGIKVLFLQRLRSDLDRLRVHQHCADHGLLRFYTMGHYSFDCIFFCHVKLCSSCLYLMRRLPVPLPVRPVLLPR